MRTTLHSLTLVNCKSIKQSIPNKIDTLHNINITNEKMGQVEAWLEKFVRCVTTIINVAITVPKTEMRQMNAELSDKLLQKGQNQFAL